MCSKFEKKNKYNLNLFFLLKLLNCRKNKIKGVNTIGKSILKVGGETVPKVV